MLLWLRELFTHGHFLRVTGFQKTTSSFISSTVDAGRSTAEEISDIISRVKALSVASTREAKSEELQAVLDKLKLLENSFVRCRSGRAAAPTVKRKDRCMMPPSAFEFESNRHDNVNCPGSDSPLCCSCDTRACDKCFTIRPVPPAFSACRVWYVTPG